MNINTMPSVVRLVVFHTLLLEILPDEHYLFVGLNGEIWAAADEPILRPTDLEQGTWGITKYAALPRYLGYIAALTVAWTDSLVEYTASGDQRLTRIR